GIAIGRLTKTGSAGSLRYELTQYSKLFGHQREIEKIDSRHIPLRPSQTLDETEPHRIFGDDEENGDRRGRRLRRHNCGDASTPNDDRHAPANQLGRQFGQLINPILCPAVEDCYIVAFHISSLSK